MSLHELYTSDEFGRYRKKLIAEVVNYVKIHLFDTTAELSEVRGALEMARRVVRMPEKIGGTQEYIKEVSRIIEKDLNDIYASIVKAHLE